MYFEVGVMTVLFMIFMQFVLKIFLNQKIDSSQILVTTLLFSIWIGMTKMFTNFMVSQNYTMKNPSPWL
jgi:FlaA1/EpsC-like NDP-sugar epimerase